MGMYDLTFAECVKNAEHFIAIGHTDIYLMKGDDALWEFVTDVEAGGSYRLGIPTGVRLIATHPCGLSFRWNQDFEPSSENGKGTLGLDRIAMRNVLDRLPQTAQQKYRDFLISDVLPEAKRRADEIRESFNRQQDAVDAIAGVISLVPTPTNPTEGN